MSDTHIGKRKHQSKRKKGCKKKGSTSKGKSKEKRKGKGKGKDRKVAATTLQILQIPDEAYLTRSPMTTALRQILKTYQAMWTWFLTPSHQKLLIILQVRQTLPVLHRIKTMALHSHRGPQWRVAISIWCFLFGTKSDISYNQSLKYYNYSAGDHSTQPPTT